MLVYSGFDERPGDENRHQDDDGQDERYRDLPVRTEDPACVLRLRPVRAISLRQVARCCAMNFSLPIAILRAVAENQLRWYQLVLSSAIPESRPRCARARRRHRSRRACRLLHRSRSLPNSSRTRTSSDRSTTSRARWGGMKITPVGVPSTMSPGSTVASPMRIGMLMPTKGHLGGSGSDPCRGSRRRHRQTD